MERFSIYRSEQVVNKNPAQGIKSLLGWSTVNQTERTRGRIIVVTRLSQVVITCTVIKDTSDNVYLEKRAITSYLRLHDKNVFHKNFI